MSFIDDYFFADYGTRTENKRKKISLSDETWQGKNTEFV